jgi:hypothetical protein
MYSFVKPAPSKGKKAFPLQNVQRWLDAKTYVSSLHMLKASGIGDKFS